MHYTWNHLSFDAPNTRDDSTILLVDTSTTPGFNLTLRTEALPRGARSFEAYVGQQQPAAGAAIDRKDPRSVAGRPAMIIDSHLKVGPETLRQQQAFIADGDSVVILTMTSRPTAAAQARSAFETALSSMRWRSS